MTLFEENLLAYVREPDISRLERAGLISQTTQNSPYYAEIQQSVSKGSAWLSLGWRFYLHWFYDIEHRISQQTIFFLLVVLTGIVGRTSVRYFHYANYFALSIAD